MMIEHPRRVPLDLTVAQPHGIESASICEVNHLPSMFATWISAAHAPANRLMNALDGMFVFLVSKRQAHQPRHDLSVPRVQFGYARVILSCAWLLHHNRVRNHVVFDHLMRAICQMTVVSILRRVVEAPIRRKYGLIEPTIALRVCSRIRATIVDAPTAPAVHRFSQVFSNDRIRCLKCWHTTLPRSPMVCHDLLDKLLFRHDAVINHGTTSVCRGTLAAGGDVQLQLHLSCCVLLRHLLQYYLPRFWRHSSVLGWQPSPARHVWGVSATHSDSNETILHVLESPLHLDLQIASMPRFELIFAAACAHTDTTTLPCTPSSTQCSRAIGSCRAHPS